MIKVGILGGESSTAGELIRILINHPDVEILTVASESEAGNRVDAVHRGLVGDTDLEISSRLDLDGHNMVFLCGEPWMARKWMADNDAACTAAEVRVVDLTGAFRAGGMAMVYGFPEFNRKAMVRGATRASIPSAAATAVELALFPLAKNSLLGQMPVDVALTMAAVETPVRVASPYGSELGANAGYVASTRLDPVAPQEFRPDTEAASVETAACLRQIQQGFDAPVSISLSRDASMSRGMRAVVDVPCSLGLPELKRLFAEAYDDHNFTYPVDVRPVIADVANTNKCLIYLEYPSTDDPTSAMSASPRLRVTAVADNLLKGAAGTAVHCMNLLFGLSERTGLALKCSAV